MKLLDSEVAKFNSNWIKFGGCWEWIGGFKQGYGVLYIDSLGKQLLAHRLSYVIHKSSELGDYLVRHTCDNPSCVNPEHLLLGTDQDNSDDAVSRLRLHMTMTKEKLEAILSNPTLSCREAAKLYGVSRQTISNVRNNSKKSYMYLTSQETSTKKGA